MQEGLKCFTKNTNRWKGFESELKDKFDHLKFLDLKELRKLAQRIIAHCVRRAMECKNNTNPIFRRKKKVTTTRRICFEKKITDIEKVSQYLFDEIRTPEEVGETCFDRILGEVVK